MRKKKVKFQKFLTFTIDDEEIVLKPEKKFTPLVDP